MYNGYGYGFSMSVEAKRVSIANVIVENFEYWTKVARNAIFSAFNRYVDGNDLATDVWMSFNEKQLNANQDAFADSKSEAESIIGSTIKLYAMNPRYVPGIRDLNKAKTANKGMDITMCSFEAVDESVSDTDSTALSIDILYARDFVSKWDMMCDKDELKTVEKLDLVRQLSNVYATCKTAEERNAVIQAARTYLDWNVDTPEEYKEAILILAKNM